MVFVSRLVRVLFLRELPYPVFMHCPCPVSVSVSMPVIMLPRLVLVSFFLRAKD